MFGPALVRYIIDPENSTSHAEENLYMETKMLKPNFAEYGKLKEECNFFQTLISRVKLIFSAGKEMKLYKQK